MLRRGSGGLLSLGSWQAPRFYVYEAGELTGAPKALLYIKESAWGPSATQVGPAPVFLGKYLELQATQANQFPLRGRKTIELGSGGVARRFTTAEALTTEKVSDELSGCGLVSMVAALLGAKAHACDEDGPTLTLLQHNISTFNSEFTKCHPIRTFSFSALENTKETFDLIFVTDLLNNPSSRIRTLKSLLSLLNRQTECIFVHSWRSPEAEKTFFEELGKCLLISRLDSQENIQKRCSQGLNCSIADSARDISEATDQDGSIDIFSVKPHEDVSEDVWRSEMKALLQLLTQEATQRGFQEFNLPLGKEGAAAAAPATAVENVAELSSEQKNAERSIASFSSCSTLSSFQDAAHQLTHSARSSGIPASAEKGTALLGRKETSERPSSHLTRSLGSATAAAIPIQHATARQPAPKRNTPQPILQQQQTPFKKSEAAATAAKVSANAAKAAAAAICTLEPGSPAAGLRPKLNTAAVEARTHAQQHLAPIDPNAKKSAAKGCRSPSSPSRSPAASAAVSVSRDSLTQKSLTAQTRLATANLNARPESISPGSPAFRASTAGPKPATETSAVPKPAPTSPPKYAAPGKVSQTKVSEGTAAPVNPVTAAALDATKILMPRVPAAARPQTSLAAPRSTNSMKSLHSRSTVTAPETRVQSSYSKSPGPVSSPPQQRRATAEGNRPPTAPQKQKLPTAAPRPKSNITEESASVKKTPAVTASAHSSSAARETALKSAPSTSVASRAGGLSTIEASQEAVNLADVPAARDTPNREQATAIGSAKEILTTVAVGGGPSKPPFATAPAASRPSTAAGAPANSTISFGGKGVSHDIPSRQTARAEKPEISRDHTQPNGGATSGRHPSGAGPLGARLVSRLSGIFKRSGSKNMKAK